MLRNTDADQKPKYRTVWIRDDFRHTYKGIELDCLWMPLNMKAELALVSLFGFDGFLKYHGILNRQ